ncbi:MAG: hypothetical protein ACFE0P_11995 [Oceanicaulis sp.]
MSGLKRICALGALTAGLPVFGALAAPPQTGQAAVLFDPRLTRAEMTLSAASAGVDIVRFGALPGSMIIEFTPGAGPAELHAAGAWLVADPVILGGCTPRGGDLPGGAP